jgi:hypothetical protein
MVNIPIDPRPFVPHGFEIQHVEGRVGGKRVVVARKPRMHEQYAIATFNPFPEGQVHFPNVRNVLEDFLNEVAEVGFQSIQECPFGAAYVQFTNVSDRDRLIHTSPIPFGDVDVSFCKHDEGINWRAANFNRDVWVLMVGPPLDHMNTEDLNACFHDIGTLLLWERDPNKKRRVVAKVRVTDLVDIPKSIRFTEGNRPEAESWTFSVEVLQHTLLGGGPPDEDPLPDDGVDPHPLPAALVPQAAPLIPAQDNNEEEEGAEDGWGHWAMGNNIQQE